MGRLVVTLALLVLLVVGAAVFLAPTLGWDGNQCGERWKC